MCCIASALFNVNTTYVNITYLCIAALNCLILLVQRDCDITLGDNNGYLAVHHAAKQNKLDCMRFLIKQGTSLEATQADGKTPAHVVGGSFLALFAIEMLSDTSVCRVWVSKIYKT